MAEWRYLRRGVVVHAIYPGPVDNLGLAECGREPGLLDDWLGTGSQDEYERAAALPRCLHCVAKIGPRRSGPALSTTPPERTPPP